MANELTGLPPGIYTRSLFGSVPSPQVVPPRIPLFIGTGQEILVQSNLPKVRGSSASVDTFVVDEDEAGRAVVSVNLDGSVTIGAFNGELSSLQVRNFPLVSGDGTGTPATDTSSVSVTINGFPTVVLSLNAAKGIVEISEAPLATDTVRCTYYFDRTDTLTTDDVSDQVTTTSATIDGLVGQPFAFTAGFNDTFSVSVDGAPAISITLPSSAPTISAAVVAATINGTAGIGSLVASTFVDNFAQTCLRLTADQSLTIGAGTANTALGFLPGAATARNRVFVTFNGPIVNGNGGGVTTTNPADVTVLVDGVQVIPTAVDGATRSVTLALAPAPGATVTVRYFWNTWQDTFDYLDNIGVTAITKVGLTPDASVASTYINGVSYVLKDDRILWGTAALVSAGLHTDGGTTFGTSQVSAALVDNRVYMSPCDATIDTSGPVSVASRTVFQLAHQPTTGNGRGNPLGSSVYASVANGRMDLPTTQPALVSAYWGYGVSDAMTRGAVTVLKVDPETSQITLASPVPEGASVYATYYYNNLVDQAFIGSSRGYTATVVTAGAGGVGTYRMTNGAGSALYGVSFLAKGAALSSVTINFPSGSEFFPDARIEGGAPVEETVTVTMATSDETPARFVNLGPSPYYFVDGASDHMRVTLDGSDQQTGLAAGIDLSAPTGGGRFGAFASMVGSEVAYSADSGETTYDITLGQNDEVNLLVDNVPVAVTATAGVGVTIGNWVTAINAAAVDVGNEPYYTTAGSFPNGFTVALNSGDTLRLHYTGDVFGPSGNQTITLAAGTYATVGALVTQINTQLATINGGLGLGATVTCSATADANLRFTLTSLGAGDASGYLEFIQGAAGATAGRSTGTTALGTVSTLGTQTLAVTVDGTTHVGTVNATPAVITGGGGTFAAVGTLASPGTSPASVVMGTVSLGSGSTFMVSIDGGLAVTATFFGTAAYGTGSGAIYGGVTAGNVLQLTINGAPITVTFAGTEAVEADYIATFNTAPANVAFQAVAIAADVGGEIRITTLRQGTSSGLALGIGSDADVLAATGFGSAGYVGSTGNVSDLTAITGAEAITVIGGVLVGASIALDSGPRLYIQTTTTGAARSVHVLTGAAQTAFGFDTLTHSGTNFVPSTLNLLVNGSSVVVPFTGSESSITDFISTLNGTLAFTAVTSVANIFGNIALSTKRQGSSATIAVTGGTSSDVLTSLGLPVASGTNAGPNNVVNSSLTTSAELISIMTGALGGAGTANVNGASHFYIESGTTGGGSTVQFLAGSIATALGLDLLLHSGTAAIAAADFALPAGIDTDTATNGLQTKLYNGPIARRFSVATTGGRLPYDRVVLRNRIFPGAGSLAPQSALAQCGLLSQGGNGASLVGLLSGLFGEAAYGGSIMGPSLLGIVGWSGGQSGAEPLVTFYDGTDLSSGAANNVFSFSVNGVTVTATFNASSTGTATALGPVTTSGSILGQIDTAITAAGLNGSVVARREGAGIRLSITTAGLTNVSILSIGEGSANADLGFTGGDSATSTLVTADALASVLMSHAQASGAFATFMLTYGAGASGYFAGRALASVAVDGTSDRFLYLQSLTLGTASSILFKTPTAASVYATRTQFLVSAGDGANGRAAVNGFFVTSSNAGLGSGSANTSVFNSGTGQDGVVGQTYVDDVTGLTFTILPRTGGVAYPTGGTATVSFRASRTLVSDGNIPTLAVPGLELTVTNTAGVVVGDSALVETFKKEGPEPSIGEVYYISYQYEKQDFTPKFFNRISDAVAEYGVVSPDNPLSLAAYFAFLNGSSVVATAQVRKQTGSSQASEASYMAAVDAVAGNSLPGNLSPAVLVLLTPATQALAVYVARHCDVQSSLRYQSERTAVFGFSGGTRPDQAVRIAQATGSTRVRFVYPDLATITLTDVLGTSRNYLVDGRYLATAVAAVTTAPSVDSATPWDGRLITGFTSLNRRLDAVVANQTANGGVTILEERLPFLRIRQGVTSDMTNILTRIPTIIQIADDMQRRARSVLSNFVGIKFLPQVLGQIEGQLSEMFKRAIQEQIINAFTGVKVTLDPDDPTAILVEAFYQPVFPLLYIQVTFRVATTR